MIVVNTKEFNTNQEKYLDMAVNGNVCIKNEKYMFHLVCRRLEEKSEKDIVFQPDDELRNCISMEEFRKRTREGIHKFFANMQQ